MSEVGPRTGSSFGPRGWRQRVSANGAIRESSATMWTLVCAVLLGGLVSGLAHAVSYIMASDESMTGRSPVIIYGTVVQALDPIAGGGGPTRYEVRVQEVLKGSIEDPSITVVEIGGAERDGTYLTVPGLPRLAVADQVLLFLRPSGLHFRIVEAGLGVFWEESLGGLRVLRREISLELLESPGAGQGELIARESEGFREWIGDRAEGRLREAGYRVALPANDPPNGPVAVAAPFVLSKACGGRPTRHSEFDRGDAVAFYFDREVEDYDLGYPESLRIESNIASVYRSVGLWVAEPGSNVRLATNGTTSAKWRLSAEDGRNGVMFDDPFGEMGERMSCGEGGLVGLTAVKFRCDRGSRLPGTNQTAVEIEEVNIAIRDGYLDCAQRHNAWAEFERLVTHEFGHAIGLDHSRDVNAIMRAFSLYPLVRPRRDRYSLAEDDIEAVRSLYAKRDHTGNTGCTPKSSALEFSFGYWDYRVWVCYETPHYEVGDASGELWSGVSGVAWFFNRDNPELMVKVLNGCPINKHMWVFVASATDLAFNLWVTQHPGGQDGSSRNWLHRNSQGGAGSRVDTAAFPCGR